MALYKKCPCCGANLDPGEKCDCENETSMDTKEIIEKAEEAEHE